MVFFSAYESDRVYRSIPICTDHILKQWGIPDHDRSDSTFNEQQAEFLQPYIFRDIQEDGAKETLHDPYDDRRDVCGKLHDRRER